MTTNLVRNKDFTTIMSTLCFLLCFHRSSKGGLCLYMGADAWTWDKTQENAFQAVKDFLADT